ncbi:DMT family transporter [Gordoniibacillus kamchatkensis]|uniref:DMT family transporter n=1 Tax=Gordoniibacillus kamchatkensis TaxID=1590651 RepID=UPI0006991D44|nr:DMT family transporter [Paenibacillus sp. VKM B-2647]
MSGKNGWWLGLACCLFAGAAFGAQFPVAGHILQTVSPMYFVGIRYLLAALAFVPLLAFKEGKAAFRLEGKALLVWLFGTLAFTGYNGLVFIGQRLAGPSGPIVSSVMMGFMPLVTAIILLVWKGVRMASATVVCIGIGLVGVFLVATKGHVRELFAGGNTVWAIALMLAAVVCWCTFTVGASLFPSWSPLRYTTLTCVGGTISNAVLIALGTGVGVLEPPAWHDLAANVWPFLYMALIAGVAAVLAWNTACKIISPVDAALFTNNIIPIVSAVITVLSGYRIGVPELAGIALTLLALIANNVAGRRRVGKREAAVTETRHGLSLESCKSLANK